MKKRKNFIYKSVALLLAIFVALLACIGFTTPAGAQDEEYATIPVVANVSGFLVDERLEGADVQLLTEDGTVLEEWTSEIRAGHTIETPLVIGKTYILRTASAPDSHDSRREADGNYYTVNYTKGYDTFFTVVKDPSGEEKVKFAWYEQHFKFPNGHMSTGVVGDKNPLNIICYRSRTLTFGAETLGTAADPDEYFEIILDIPKGIPGQVMNVDLSNADDERNPSQIVIPDDGSESKTSFWLKDGQTISIDGFPLLITHYYSLYENNETLNEEGYITKILTAEYMNQIEADFLIIQGINLIGKAQPLQIKSASMGLFSNLFRLISPNVKFAKPEVTKTGIDVMTAYANEKMFEITDPAVVTDNIENPMYETLGGIRGTSFTVSDTLSDGTDTTRSASKLGKIPCEGMLVDENAVFGNGYVLFINRRDGVTVIKEDEAGKPVEGAELQILDEGGSVVHEFTTTDEESTVIALAPGEYKLHEKKAPENYVSAEDVAFTVVDYETVKVNGEDANAVKMTDKALVDISVEKIWEDSDDADGIRPDSITVYLLADGQKTDSSLTLNESSKWKGTFEDLPKYAEGKEIVYTVEEETPADYKAEYSGSAEEGFKITNTHESKKTPEEPTSEEPTTPEEKVTKSTDKSESPTTADAKNAPAESKAEQKPQTGDTSNTPLLIIIMALSVSIIFLLVLTNLKRHN